MSNDLSHMRADYRAGALRRADLAADPLDQFLGWFEAAREAGLPEPNAMTLATLGADGAPSARTVLLKEADERGFVFFTNYASRKAGELETEPRASLHFLWRELARQVEIRGPVAKISAEESRDYFRTRPYPSRIGAWASRQSREVPDRGALEERFLACRERFPDTGEDDCVPLPEFWGGYRLAPESFEFWQGQTARLHDRFLYRPAEGDEGGWSIVRLSP